MAVSKNDVTGDKIQTKIGGNVKAFDKGMDLIPPSCQPDCKYLVNTLSKCRTCNWKIDVK
jgi:hypothetical protein